MKPFDKLRTRGFGKPAAPATVKAGDEFVPAEQWLEHLEQEIEPKCLAAEKEELDLVLKNSSEDRAVRESLVRVRAAVKSLDDVALPESGHYYDNLHSKIMAAIDGAVSDTTENAINGEPERSPVLPKRPRGFARAATFGAMGMTMMIAIVAFVGLNKQTASSDANVAANRREQAAQTTDENFERKIAMVDSHSGAVFAHEMGSFESEEDFLTESAAQRLKQLSNAQADALIRLLKR